MANSDLTYEVTKLANPNAEVFTYQSGNGVENLDNETMDEGTT